MTTSPNIGGRDGSRVLTPVLGMVTTAVWCVGAYVWSRMRAETCSSGVAFFDFPLIGRDVCIAFAVCSFAIGLWATTNKSHRLALGVLIVLCTVAMGMALLGMALHNGTALSSCYNF